MIARNDTCLCGGILVLFFESHPVYWAEISHMNRQKIYPGTEPARLPGSHEEALK